MKERCRDGCRTSLLIAGVVLVPAIFHTSLPPCHPYISIHFMEMIFSTCIYSTSSKLHRNTLPRKNLIFAQIHKSAKGMLLQYSGAALVRDADIEMAK